MSILRETCWCGHDKATHYFDRVARPPAPLACLASGCDCEKYINENDPKPRKLPERPRHIPDCQCYGCKQYQAAWLDMTRKKTDPLPP